MAINVARKTMTYSNAAGSGAVGTVTLFNVTGEVLVHYLVAFCTVDLTSGSAAILSTGVTGNVTLFIPTEGFDQIDANEFVASTSIPDGYALESTQKDQIIEENIINDVTVAALTGGTIRYTVYYSPISSDGNVVAA